MRQRVTAVVVSCGAAVLALSPGAATAMAHSAAGWTVKPGGNVTYTGTVRFKDGKTGAIVTCPKVTLTGSMASGPGPAIGRITKATFAACSIATIAATVTAGAGSLPWELNARVYNQVTGVTTGSIEDIDLRVFTPACSAVFDGTGAGANDGLIAITYTNATGKIKLAGSGRHLHSWASNVCDLLNDGDPQMAMGSGPVTPKQTITSP